MRAGLHPEVLKTVFMLRIEEKTVDAEHVHFKPNTIVTAARMSSVLP